MNSHKWISMKKKKPTVGEPVDIYSSDHGRLTNYRYVKNYGGQRGNNFFEPVEDGYCVVRSATHWMNIPEEPKCCKNCGEKYE